MSVSNGAAALASAVKPRVIGASELAKELGVSQQIVSNWANGRRVPSMKNRMRLKKRLGIPLEAWEPAK